MADALATALANLKHNAAAYRAAGADLQARQAGGSATGANDVVSVTVDGAGEITAVRFTGDAQDPTRWSRGFDTAYTQALSERQPVAAPAQVAGVIAQPMPDEDNEVQREAKAYVARRGEDAMTRPADPDRTWTATVDGVTLTVDTLGLVIETSISRSALDAGPQAQDLAFRAALDAALAHRSTDLYGDRS